MTAIALCALASCIGHDACWPPLHRDYGEGSSSVTKSFRAPLCGGRGASGWRDQVVGTVVPGQIDWIVVTALTDPGRPQVAWRGVWFPWSAGVGATHFPSLLCG